MTKSNVKGTIGISMTLKLRGCLVLLHLIRTGLQYANMGKVDCRATRAPKCTRSPERMQADPSSQHQSLSEG